MAAILILNASQQPYISIGVRFGGIKMNGHEYVYHPVKDAFIRKDFAKHTRGKTWEQFVEFIKQQENESTDKP
jgi:hypothetical protein